MSPSCELDYPANTPQFFVSPVTNARVGIEQEAQSEPETTFASEGRWVFTGITTAPENISDVIVNRLSEVNHVKAILMGRSGDIYHVWTMLEVWSAVDRRSVYAAQRDLLAMLKGFDLDFYVVDANDGEDPRELVSDIPIVWERAA